MLRRISSYLLICGFTLFTIGSCQPKEHNSYRFAKGATTPVVDFRINGIWASFLVDTGAELSLITPEFFNAHSELFTTTDTVTFASVTASGVDTLIGIHTSATINDTIPVNLRVNNMGTAAEELSRQSGRKVIGILGYDFIYNNQVVFDYKSHELPKFKNEE